MRRRAFISLLGGAAGTSLAWPLSARAQQAAMPVVGFLSTRGAADSVHVVAAFHTGMKEVGFVEGQTVTVQYHWAGSETIGCRSWLPIWFALGWPSLPQLAPLPRSQRRAQLRRFRSFSPSAVIRSRSASSPA
jgi:hypothetical protein